MRFSRYQSSSMLWTGVIFLFCAPMFGQSERGTIQGTVRDTSGAIIPGAKVTVTETATNVKFNQTTNDTGDFTIPSLAVGSYNVRVEKEGFKPSLVTGLTVNAATTSRADISLEVGTSQ